MRCLPRRNGDRNVLKAAAPGPIWQKINVQPQILEQRNRFKGALPLVADEQHFTAAGQLEHSANIHIINGSFGDDHFRILWQIIFGVLHHLQA